MALRLLVWKVLAISVSFQSVDSWMLRPTKNTSIFFRCLPKEHLTAFFVAATMAVAPLDVAHAACVQGDTSTECIGVYKTPGPLESSSSSNPLTTLDTQRSALVDIQQVVLEGRLEEAGIKLLNVLPRVTTAGRLLVQEQQQGDNNTSSPVVQELQQTRIQNQYETLLALLGQCDVSIGQGLRGQMGSITMAQLSVLDEVKDVIRALDDFVALVDRK